MRRAPLLVLAALLVAAPSPCARAEDPVELTPAQLHRARGTLAWSRAVWGVSREGFQRAISEFEHCREDASSGGDFTMLYLLGISYLRLGRVAEADPVLKDARSLQPGFQGLRLTEAMRLATMEGSSPDDTRQLAAEAIAKFDAYLADLGGYPKDGPFADEFRFLGLVLRGSAYSRVGGKRDQAVVDLTAALALAKEHGATPSAELVTLLANMHQALDQIDDAKKLIQEAAARDPFESAHYYNYGVILAGMHDDTGARPWFEAALARRADFAEARVKLAYIASRASDLPAMRSHLEAAAAIYEGRSGNGATPDPRDQAEIDAGLGTYWKMIGLQRSDAGDAAGAREAFAKAQTHLRAAVARQPGCVAAINLLIQILSYIGAPEAEQAEWKQRLIDLKSENRRIDPYRSTFC